MSLNNDNDALLQTELTLFTKYSKLVPLLRESILSYAQGTELKNYAECSTYCNSEVQRFNTIAPNWVKIKEEDDEVSVMNIFKWPHQQIKKFKKSANMMDDIRRYIMKCYKYVKEGRTESLHINMKQWPTELININVLAEIDDFKVTIYDSMYKDFMVYANKNKLKKIRLSYFGDHQLTLPADFFKSQLFKNADVFVAENIVCVIDDDDFVDLQHSFISIVSSISYEAIRRKVEKINADAKTINQRIEFLSSDEHIFDMDVLLPLDRFPNQFILEEEENKTFQIGKVGVTVYCDCILELLVEK